MGEHPNGHACSNGVCNSNADGQRDCWSGKTACEKPMLEIEALAVAIYALGLQADDDKLGIRTGDTISMLGWMIRDRLMLIDRNIFPGSPVFDDNYEAKEVANG